MIVHTELGRYEVEEIGRGRFRLRVLEHTEPERLDKGNAIGEWWEPIDATVYPLTIRIGASFRWERGGHQFPDDGSNRITRIEP